MTLKLVVVNKATKTGFEMKCTHQEVTGGEAQNTGEINGWIALMYWTTINILIIITLIFPQRYVSFILINNSFYRHHF